ncbi:MAG: Glycogen synthase [Candidatus Izimaplasma bacterium HR2]|nr:MAG: Glycogen synthase [Candidatus Izimaplasma bacterium HR2]
MKVLFVGSEATPFSKTGGLADVLGALPKELVKLGIDARVVLPKHGVTKQKFHNQMKQICNFKVTVGPKQEYAGIEMIELEGVTFYFVDNEYYFGYRDTLYGHYDDGERYGFFDNAVLKMLEEMDYYPDIIHGNDWQTGLIPYILKQNYQDKPKYKNIKTVYTIHNIAYQGVYSKDLLPYLDVEFNSELEFENMINFMKCGINTADFITTVSETYAEEILYDYFGFGMSNILKTRKNELFGIINGIDYTDFNPKVDKKIGYNYSLFNYLKGKRENKAILRKELKMGSNKLPIIGIVSRLANQKGFDLIEEVIEDYLKNNKMQLVLLGSGDGYIENYYKDLKKKYPKNVGVHIGYSDELARKVYAGSDMFLMPSRFEPCGLAQLISLKYGTLPIVRLTGGLKDSIIPFNQYTLEGNGFGFDNYNAKDMASVIDLALDVYKDKKIWKMLVKRGMEEDFSWEQSALKYINLYKKLEEE